MNPRSDIDRAIAQFKLRSGLIMCDTVTVSRRRAIEMASNAITKITEFRRDHWVALITDRKNARGRARFWMPWLKPLSSEVIRRQVSQEYPNPDCLASDAYRKAQAVLAMCSAVEDGDCVTISAQTLADITL